MLHSEPRLSLLSRLLMSRLDMGSWIQSSFNVLFRCFFMKVPDRTFPLLAVGLEVGDTIHPAQDPIIA